MSPGENVMLINTYQTGAKQILIIYIYIYKSLHSLVILTQLEEANEENF